jgi:hypothetical protein
MSSLTDGQAAADSGSGVDDASSDDDGSMKTVPDGPCITCGSKVANYFNGHSCQDSGPPASIDLYFNLVNCVCDTPCGAQGGACDSYCNAPTVSDIPAPTPPACLECMQSSCQSDWAACEADGVDAGSSGSDASTDDAGDGG